MSRIEKLRELLEAQNLDAFYINHIPNVRYLSGFSGSSAYIILTRDKNYFITDFRYKDQSHAQVKGYEIAINYNNNEEVKKIFDNNGFKRVGFESGRITFHSVESMKKDYPSIEFVPLHDEIEKLTMQKTPEELQIMRKACEITDKTFSHILDIIRPGMTELDVSAEITYSHKKLGALKDSFEPIVASGWRGALPHGIASDKTILHGELVTLDFGCMYEGFCSDLTRTIAIGEPNDKMKKIYQVVYDAQHKALEQAKAGMTTKELDSVARDYITSCGYGEHFGHGLGHGVGIEVHEMPGVSQRTNITLIPDSVITIEPGIYIENLGGVRIEDDIVVRENGCEILNKSKKELIIL
ncbi:MAG: aminopeptidase P family protein [Ignavibacteriae bacterium]|nr:MAG: aminopeptidase P family protein [Ignavibacteriota bacterium]